MINLSDGGDGGFAATARDSLLDGDTGRQTFHQIDVRLLELLDKLPRVGRHAIEKTALAFGEKNVEGERGFARAAESGDDDHLVARNADVDVLEVVLTRAVDLDGAVGVLRMGERTRLTARVAIGWSARLAERFFGRAHGNYFIVACDDALDHSRRGAANSTRGPSRTGTSCAPQNCAQKSSSV